MDADAPRDENARRTVRPRARRKAGDPCLAVCLLAEPSSWEPCSPQSPAHRLLSITGEAGVADGTAAMVTVITGADGTDVAVMAATAAGATVTVPITATVAGAMATARMAAFMGIRGLA